MLKNMFESDGSIYAVEIENFIDKMQLKKAFEEMVTS